MRILKWLVFISCMLFLSESIKAQSDSSQYKSNQISEVQIVGKKLMVLPGSGVCVSNDYLAKINQTDVNRVLRMVPGVNVRDEEGFGLRPNIGLRGTPVNRSAKITLMEDGVLMAPAPYADPSAYYFPTFARIESLEVLKGSSQIQYGPYTIGGALNLISTSIPDSFAAFLQASYGSFNTNQQRVWVGDSHKTIDYVFEVNRLASNGFKKLDAGGNTGFDRRDFMGKIRWSSEPSASVSQSLTIKFLNASEISNESYLGLTYSDYVANPLKRYAATQKDGLELKHCHLSVTHIVNLKSNLKFNTTGYLVNTFRDWSRINSVGGKGVFDVISNPVTNDSLFQILTGNHDGTLAFQSAERSYESKGVQSTMEWSFETTRFRNRLSLGARYHTDFANRFATNSDFQMLNGSMVLSTPGIKGNGENQIRMANSVAAFMYYEFGYGKLSIHPGLRIEHIRLDFENYGNNDYPRSGSNLKQASNQLNVLLPGIGFNYRIADFSSVFGGIHKGFSPPGMPSVTSQEQATSESAINYELGYRLRNKHVKIQAVGFWNSYGNILGSDNVSGGGQGTGNMFNAGKADVKGFEFYMEYDLMNALSNTSDYNVPISISYTFTDARFMETFVGSGGDWGSGVISKHDYIPFIAPHLLSMSIGFEHRRFNAYLIARHVSDTRVRPSKGSELFPNVENELSEINSLEGYTTLDLSCNFTVRKGLYAFITVNNLLNDTHIVANLPQGYRPGMPFSFTGGLKVNL